MRRFDFNDREIAQRLVAENERTFAFLTNIPIVPGHTLICPKQTIALSEDIPLETWSDLLALKSLVCAKLKNALNAKGFNFAWNEGLMAGQTVPHFHLHVVPRTENDHGITQYEPRSFLYRPGSRAKSPEEELIVLSKTLRET